jgi:8-oxo-dGTP pyrophosphatase MutT (NUDIX family)
LDAITKITTKQGPCPAPKRVPPDDFQRLTERLSRLEPRQVTPAPDQREAAVAVVLVPGADGSFDLLLIKRAEHEGDPWSGQIALPGGRRDAEDPDLLTTAIRETDEETGVRLSPGSRVGQLDDLSPVSRHLPQLIVRPYVFYLPNRPAVTPSDEVALHLWVSCDALVAHRSEETLIIRGEPWRVPGYRVGPHFLWGMTERILSPLLEVVRR